MNLGERIKIVRKDNELTQKDFAELFGLSHSHISNIENNREKPSDTLLLFICSKFGINFNWLKFGTPDNTSNDKNVRKDTINKFINIVQNFENKFSELDDNELQKYINSAYWALLLVFDTYTYGNKETREIQETFLEKLCETNFNTSKFDKHEISENEFELKWLYTKKLYDGLKELNNSFDKYQMLMYKETYIEPY